MKPKDIFGLALRLLGLYFTYLAVMNVAGLFAGPPARVVFITILTSAFHVVVGWWMLGGAPMLMQKAYPDPDDRARGVADTAGPI